MPASSPLSSSRSPVSSAVPVRFCHVEFLCRRIGGPRCVYRWRGQMLTTFFFKKAPVVVSPRSASSSWTIPLAASSVTSRAQVCDFRDLEIFIPCCVHPPAKSTVHEKEELPQKRNQKRRDCKLGIVRRRKTRAGNTWNTMNLEFNATRTGTAFSAWDFRGLGGVQIRTQARKMETKSMLKS